MEHIIINPLPPDMTEQLAVPVRHASARFRSNAPAVAWWFLWFLGFLSFALSVMLLLPTLLPPDPKPDPFWAFVIAILGVFWLPAGVILSALSLGDSVAILIWLRILPFRRACLPVATLLLAANTSLLAWLSITLCIRTF